MRLIGPILALLLAAQPALAKPSGLVVKMGETWIFSVAHGQPAKARRAAVKAMPAAGEMKVSLSALMGTTMTITNNGRFDYAYRATLILPDGKTGVTKSCAVPANGRLAMEHWSNTVAAIRLSDFKRAPAGSLCP